MSTTAFGSSATAAAFGALALFVTGMAPNAGATERTHTVQVFKTADDQGTLRVELDSQMMGFSLHDLLDGETRSTVTADGQNVTLTRLGDEITMDVDGRVVNLPVFDATDEGVGLHDGGQHREIRMIRHMPEGLTISTPQTLDEQTRQRVRTALAAAGIEDAVHFSTGLVATDCELPEELFTGDGEREVKIIRRKLEQ